MRVPGATVIPKITTRLFCIEAAIPSSPLPKERIEGEGRLRARTACGFVSFRRREQCDGRRNLGQLRETRSRFRSPSSRAARAPLRLPFILHKRPQPPQRRIPLPRNLIEIPLHIRQPLRPQLPHRFPPSTRRARQPRLLERMQMLRDRLARDLRAIRQPHNRQRPLRAQPPDDPQTRLVTQRREDNRRVRPFRRRRQPTVVPSPAAQPFAGIARYFSMSFICAAHPPSLAANALARRSIGIWSKPDSVTVSFVPP